jgi:hypothetical protein
MSVEGAEIVAVRGPKSTEKKKVRFSPFPEYHEGIPWKCQSNGASRQTEKLLLNEGEILYPMQDGFKDGAFVLRAEREGEDGFGCFGICALIACLIVLFLLIWFVVNKVLLLEIESQVNSGSGVRVVGGRLRLMGHVDTVLRIS